jgi:hypothetical protein
MSAPFRLLTLHPWFRPEQAPALDWLEALGGRQAPLAHRATGSVSAGIAAGLGLGRDLALRPSPWPAPTHIQLLDADLAMLVAVSAALPALAMEGAVVVVDLAEAGLNAGLTPFGREVVSKFAREVAACGAGAPRFVGRSVAARDGLQVAGLPALLTAAHPPRPSSGDAAATPAAWRAVLDGLVVDSSPLRRELVS